MHCSVLATDGLKVAVDDYLKSSTAASRSPARSSRADPNFDPHADEDHDHDDEDE